MASASEPSESSLDPPRPRAMCRRQSARRRICDSRQFARELAHSSLRSPRMATMTLLWGVRKPRLVASSMPQAHTPQGEAASHVLPFWALTRLPPKASSNLRSQLSIARRMMTPERPRQIPYPCRARRSKSPWDSTCLAAPCLDRLMIRGLALRPSRLLPSRLLPRPSGIPPTPLPETNTALE